MATYNTVIKKRNATNNGWDSVLPITTAENVLINAEGDTLATHLADFTQQIPYAVTAGSANAYTAATTPALPALVAGVAIAVKIHAANTGAATLNWNGKGAKSIKNPDGTNVESGDLAVGGVFTLRYDGTNFILQGKGGVKLTGTAVAADVLSGKTFYRDNAKTKLTGTIPSKGAQTYTPTTTNQTIATEQYLSGVQTILGSPNLIPANIKEGVNIFGKIGTLVPISYAAKNVSFSISASTSSYGYTYSEYFTIDNLNFTPRQVFASATHRQGVNEKSGHLAYGDYLTARVNGSYGGWVEFSDVVFSPGQVTGRFAHYKDSSSVSGYSSGTIFFILA
ncbi:hypothetical protein DesLBE_1942 [Desulfitobacterium sp. LBE]|uniref:Major tropism determinant N-terminal domain-containing protein n=1 Tax=Desulfitobacterium hafniense TaxID=49338 RepID=A0A098B5I2_DESHA|nr:MULTISPECIES: hypothetical protein [Desulfitobacterium]TWH57653.1 hypothetical protein DesLBE_1942 [Desulfitobacterium sp. LBE]CDX04138.1 Hypothetical protein DPCES_4252 [Desulfitobacterium hafniense]